ncbi:MAG: RagB/SusD family nutrient uptake outer membrane protein, partial [Bacteroidota bacterium]
SSTNYGIWGGAAGPADLDRLNWSDAYKTIRKCNTFIQEIKDHKTNFTDAWYNKRLDEARFLRAYYYSRLWMHIGGVPIITEVQSRTQDSSELYKARNTFEETFNFLTSELGTVANDGFLATKYNAGDANAGRVTLGASLALKGWLEL